MFARHKQAFPSELNHTSLVTITIWTKTRFNRENAYLYQSPVLVPQDKVTDAHLEYMRLFHLYSFPFVIFQPVERVVKAGPNPISQEIVVFKSQLKSHNPSLFLKLKSHSHFSIFFFHESQSQCTKSHFPASKKGKSQLPFYPFTTLCRRTAQDNSTWRSF